MTRSLAISLSLMLATCSTTIYHENGKPKFRTYADAAHLRYDGTTLEVTNLDHSGPTRAAGSVVGTTLSGMAAAGITGGVR